MKRIAMLLAVAALVAAPAVVFAAEPFSATLTPEAEVPPATSDGSGTASVTISDDGTEITYEVTYQGLTGPAGASHIHFGAADVAGPVIIPFAVGDSPFSGTVGEADYVTPGDATLPQTWADALDAIRAGDTYVNVHTELFPGGEIRGQLAELPDTATPASDVVTRSTDPSMPAILLALLGLAVFVFAMRRFQFGRG